MNEQIKKFVEAVKADDQEKGIEAAAEIASTILSDLRRIADACEAIAKKSE